MAEEKVRITQHQGNTLLGYSFNFGLPEKLGEDKKFTEIDRTLAEEEVGELWEELKSRSPLLQKKRRLCFGPAENWEEIQENGKKDWELKDFDKEVEIRVNDNKRSGILWCLLLMFHPGNPRRLSASAQRDIGWPLARCLKLDVLLKEQLGLDKASHRRLDLEGKKKEEKKEEEKEEPKEPEEPKQEG